ncbi:MAG: tautomerase family protein [Oscillospiraceae bacterium]|nr:tautomerase family protein [Oscillospiraceae bacterium]
MPLVKIEIFRGQSAEYKSKLITSVTQGLDASLSVPSDKLTQRIYELDKEHFITPPGKSDKFTVIEIIMFPGRDDVLKKSAISEITRLLGDSPGIPPNDVYIIMEERTKENWGSGGLQGTEFAK